MPLYLQGRKRTDILFNTYNKIRRLLAKGLSSQHIYYIAEKVLRLFDALLSETSIKSSHKSTDIP